MTASGSKSLPSIGFLTVRSLEELGLIGGYLILNNLGRPLEFHCTAPVRASRAQEILYGVTLAPFLYGEHIGQTLVSSGRVKPLFVCTDVAPALSLRDHVPLPVALLAAPPEVPAAAASPGAEPLLRVDPPHAARPPAAHHLVRFRLGQLEAAVDARHRSDETVIQQRWRADAEQLDLLEPFSRLADAIAEAQRGASQLEKGR